MDFENIIYIVLFVGWLLSRLLGGKKSPKRNSPTEGRPTQQNPESRPRPATRSLEDLLREFAGEEPEPEPERRREPALQQEEEETEYESIFDEERFLEETRAKSKELKTIDELVDINEPIVGDDRLLPYRIKKRRGSSVSHWFTDIDAVKRGIIIKEILDRKF